MRKIISIFLLLVLTLVTAQAGERQEEKPREVLAIVEQGTPHQGFCDAAKRWLDANAGRLNIHVTYLRPE